MKIEREDNKLKLTIDDTVIIMEFNDERDATNFKHHFENFDPKISLNN